jgi:hypothetical protein
MPISRNPQTSERNSRCDDPECQFSDPEELAVRIIAWGKRQAAAQQDLEGDALSDKAACVARLEIQRLSAKIQAAVAAIDQLGLSDPLLAAAHIWIRLFCLPASVMSGLRAARAERDLSPVSAATGEVAP